MILNYWKMEIYDLKEIFPKTFQEHSCVYLVSKCLIDECLVELRKGFGSKVKFKLLTSHQRMVLISCKNSPISLVYMCFGGTSQLGSKIQKICPRLTKNHVYASEKGCVRGFILKRILTLNFSNVDW